MEFFTNTKHKTPTLNQTFVVYGFKCTGCNAKYVGAQHMFDIAKLTPSLFSNFKELPKKVPYKFSSDEHENN